MRLQQLIVSFALLCYSPLYADDTCIQTDPAVVRGLGTAEIDEILGTTVESDELRPAWVLKRGIAAPAGVTYDAIAGELYVSQIGGEGDKKDGDGVISRVNLDGEVAEFAWITGLQMPKGLAIHGRTLWVSDIDMIVEVDIAAGKVTRTLPIVGAKFLTGIAVDRDGNIYVGDMLTSRLYCVAMADRKVSVFAEGKELESPGALVIDNGRLLVGGWGFTTDYTTEKPGTLFAIDLKSRKKSNFANSARGNWLGLCRNGVQGFWAADFEEGKIYRIDRSGKETPAIDLPRGTAGICFVPDSRLLVVTETRENRVVGYNCSRNAITE